MNEGVGLTSESVGAVSVAGGEASRLPRLLEWGVVTEVDTSLLGVDTFSSGVVCSDVVIVFLRCGTPRGRLSSEPSWGSAILLKGFRCLFEGGKPSSMMLKN